MDVSVEMSGSSDLEAWVNVFGDFSYASHLMPLKPDYPRTLPKTKDMTKNPTLVSDRYEEVLNHEIHRQPKGLREATCARIDRP